MTKQPPRPAHIPAYQYPAPKPSRHPARGADWHNPAYKNKAHCFYCKSRLKKAAGVFGIGMRWASVCKKCGRTQPWYDDPKAAAS